MERHKAIRSILLALFALVAGQQFVTELRAKVEARHAFQEPAQLRRGDTLAFFAAPEWLAPPDHLAIPVLGIQPRALHDDFLGGRKGHVHHAIDIMAPRGTPVVAAADGTIARILFSQAGGKTLYLLDASGAAVYYYAHLDRYAAIRETQRVRKGEILGFVGTTGNAPKNAPHLHFAIDAVPTANALRGTPVNPFPILTQRGVTYRLAGGELASSTPVLAR